MKIIDRWNEFMGPKDERLAAESNRCAAVGYTILIIGSALCLYYGIMLNQVAETTGHPLLTPLGQSVFPCGHGPTLSSFSPQGSSPRTCRCAAAPSTPIRASPKRIAFPGTTWPWCRFCAASGWASQRRPCAFSRKCRSSASRT